MAPPSRSSVGLSPRPGRRGRSLHVGVAVGTGCRRGDGVSPWGRGVAVGMWCLSMSGVASGMVLPWGRCRLGDGVAVGTVSPWCLSMWALPWGRVVSPCGRCRGDAVALHVRVAVGTRCIYICLACLLSLSCWLNVGCVCLCCTFFSGCVASPIPTHTHNYLITTSQPEF